MGPGDSTTGRGIATSGNRLGRRICLRKGCGRGFQPRQWNQRYCQDPECLGEVRRWQAAKRQRQRRATPEGRQRHAEEECRRRQRDSSRADPPERDAPDSPQTGCAACAWSRSNKNLPEIFCDRPGCYEPPRESPRVAARYCGDACRAAMRRVQDRERKYLSRKTKAGRLKRRLEYQAAKVKRCQRQPVRGNLPSASSLVHCDIPRGSVLPYRGGGQRALGCFGPKKEVMTDDPETTPGARPRAPPAS